MRWSTRKARIHSLPKAFALELKCSAQFCVAGLKPVNVNALHALLFVTGVAAPEPGALAQSLNSCLYALDSFGCLVWTLLSTALAKAGVGVVTEKTLGSTK